jgi:hypothetical protein
LELAEYARYADKVIISHRSGSPAFVFSGRRASEWFARGTHVGLIFVHLTQLDLFGIHWRFDGLLIFPARFPLRYVGCQIWTACLDVADVPSNLAS